MSSKTKRLGTLADIYRSQNLDGTISQLQLKKIQPSDKQPRQNRTIGINDLSESLKRDGLLTPLIVTKVENHYRIIAGERRYHAASLLGWEYIECRIISRKEQDYWRIAIIENLQRENLSPREEAQALMHLKKQENASDAKLASLVGKSRSYITEILGIAQLPEEVFKSCQENNIHQYNMLIQVVQAYRKGNVDQFIKNYQKGNIQNVRLAKQFNQKGEGSLPTTTIDQKPKINEYVTKEMKTHAQLQGNNIIIECPNVLEAQKIMKRIKSLLVG